VARKYGRIHIEPELLLNWLQFDGGKIIAVSINDSPRVGLIELLVEHTEMPEGQDGDIIPCVIPQF
jgi:hypothetical protein